MTAGSADLRGYPRSAVVCGYPLSTLPAPRRRTGQPAPLRPPNPFGRAGRPAAAGRGRVRGPHLRNLVDHANTHEEQRRRVILSHPVAQSIAQNIMGGC